MSSHAGQGAEYVNGYLDLWFQDHKFTAYTKSASGIVFDADGSKLEGDIHQLNELKPKSFYSAETRITMTFKDGELDVVLGAPGGTQIAMGVLQVLLNVIDHGMEMQAAVSAPRFSSTSNAIDVCNRIPRHTTRQLEADGYAVGRNPYNYTIGWVHAIQVQPDRLHGGADPGRDGVAYRLREADLA